MFIPLAMAVLQLQLPNGRITPAVAAVRASGPAPRIDGRLDDAIWQTAPVAGAFTQQQPRDGAPASERTEVRVAYDDDAIYIAARMFDSQPDQVAGTLSRRDNIDQSDRFQVAIDSYHDHQTTFQFAVNPAGVRADGASSGDFDHGDAGWDPVWQAATTRDSLGWTAEIRIPLSQLRFPAAPVQTWGIDFSRWIQRRGELDLWAYYPRTTPGFASNFGHLAGLERLPQPRRLDLLPYVAGSEQRLAAGTSEVSRAGLDAQYGLTSDLTLNATVHPDFGQVEADPEVINLTAYETHFQERRPFFVEGAGIFTSMSPGVIPINGPAYLYSRRISSSIIGAGKLTGRTASGWSLGLLDAATSDHPGTNYAAVRAKNDFGNGVTTLGFTGTATNRASGDSTTDLLRSAAYAGGIDFSRRFRQNAYSMYAAVGGSYVTGGRAAMDATQLSSARWFQRPDAAHSRYDSTRTALGGWFAALGFAKDEGNTRLGFGVDAWSPGFEINDLGWATRVDRTNVMGRVEQIWNHPGRVVRSARLEIQSDVAWNFDGDRTATAVLTQLEAELANFWQVEWHGQFGARVIDDGLLRGGPAGVTPAMATGELAVATDTRKALRFELGVSGGTGGLGYRELAIGTDVMFRPAPMVSLSVGPSYDVARIPMQYVTSDSDLTATATFGRRYILGEIRRHTLDLTTRVGVTFTPALTLQLWMQPLVGTGEYLDYREVVRPRSTDFIIYGRTPGSTDTRFVDAAGATWHILDPDGAGPRAPDTLLSKDFNQRSLRGNAVLRWEYRPGSTLFFVWTQSCEAFSPNPAFAAGRDLGRLCQGRGDNVFAIKLNYWISL